MTTTSPFSSAVRAGLALLGVSLGFAAAARAQSAPPAPASVPAPGSVPKPEETVTLSPFEVTTDSDKSYGALNSNSITPFNTELKRMPVSADIFTDAFMKDVGAVSVEDMITSFSAGAGSALASPSTSGANAQPGDRNANSFLALRGLTAPTMQRDGFMPVNTYIQSGATGTGFSSNFDIERVDVVLGPQSLLYGVGGAGGVINLVSKQARFNKESFGSFQFQDNQYGQKLTQFDAGWGNDKVAVRVAATDQYAQGGRRVYLGGPMQGLYLQLAFNLPHNTVLRWSGESSEYNRIAGTTGQTFTALSTATDARNGQNLRYLLATNQLQASATGPSGAGYIGAGKINWDNVDSYASWWNTNEYTKNKFTSLTADTRWNSWLTTQLALGYRTTFDSRVGNTITFAAPNVATNPTGTWAIGQTGGMPVSDLQQPVRQKTIRFSALMTNELFAGKVHSQTVFGADFARSDGAVITYAYVKADSNFNPTTTNTATATGYAYASQLWYPVVDGPVRRPLWEPRTVSRVTYNGQNYVRVQTNLPQKNLISPTNPEGLFAGGASALGDYRVGETLNKGVYAANYTNWLDGKLDILLGVRAGDSYSLQATEAAGAFPSVNSSLDTKTVSFNAGADYALLPWLRAYVSVSDSFDPPAIYVAGPLGDYPVSAKGIGEEVGLKISNAANTISGSIAVYHTKSKNEESSLTSTLLFDINPSGLNGLYNAPSVWINLDRQAQGVQVALTASPTSNWRMRLSAAKTDGTVDSTKSFSQLYNDQFYANAAGQVTYKDGTVVYVNPAGAALPVASTAAGAVPLTIAKMSTVGDIYYASPQAVTGAISRTGRAGVILIGANDPAIAVHGPILTGATGLPISMQQINPGFKPPGTIVTNVAGEKSVGYPVYNFVFTNNYTFSEGWLRGVSIGGTVSLGWQYRAYYYYPNGLSDPNNASRALFTWPTQTRFDGLLGYRHKLGQRYMFSTQLNVGNMFNRYHVLIVPSYTAGFGPTAILNATFDQQPRTYVWSSTISF